jgi:predicted DNA-binding transcriptional regulator AlpA
MTVDPNEPNEPAAGREGAPDRELMALLSAMLARTQRETDVDRSRASAPQSPSTSESALALPPPRMIGAAEAARRCGISRTAWYNLKAGGRLPTPIRLGRRVLWRVEELEAWMDAKCPPRHQWQWSGEVTAKRGARR